MKKGLILRSEIRRVPCPKCGAQPGAFCTTFDKREHQERATAAITHGTTEQLAEASAANAEAMAQILSPQQVETQMAENQAAAAAQEIAQVHDVAVGQPVALCPTPTPDPVFDAIPEPDDDDGKAFTAYLGKLKEKQKLVRVTWYHGPLVLTWDGYITRLPGEWGTREVTLVQVDGRYTSILAGANDSIIITDL